MIKLHKATHLPPQNWYPCKDHFVHHQACDSCAEVNLAAHCIDGGQGTEAHWAILNQFGDTDLVQHMVKLVCRRNA